MLYRRLEDGGGNRSDPQCGHFLAFRESGLRGGMCTIFSYVGIVMARRVTVYSRLNLFKQFPAAGALPN